MKKIIPMKEWEYEFAGEGIEYILDRRYLFNKYGIDSTDFNNYNTLRSAIKNEVGKDKMVVALSFSDHSIFTFYYGVDDTKIWGGNGFLILDKDMFSSRPNIDYINDLYNGWLYELVNEDEESEQILTSSEAWELENKEGYQLYEYKTVRELVPAN